jgi:inner membrane protein
MASTVGHSLAGFAVYLATTPRDRLNRAALWRDRGRIAFFMFLANLPDLDFLIGFLVWGDAERIHGGVTHGLPVAAAIAAALAFAFPAGMSRARSFLVYFAVVASHSLIDLFTSFHGIGFVPTYGVTILAPFSDAKVILPVSLFLGAGHGSLEKLLSLHNVAVVVYEVVVFGALDGVVLAVKLAGNSPGGRR